MMPIRRKKQFLCGLVMLVFFCVLFWLMMMPLFHDDAGRPLNSLQYADTVFNSLSKGSSYFIPAVHESISSVDDMHVSLAVQMARSALVPLALNELATAGLSGISEADDVISFQGSLSALLRSATDDADALYNNEGDRLSARYHGAAPLEVSQAWWYLLNPCVKALEQKGEIAAAKVVDEVVKKAVEPGNNFYGLPAAHVREHFLLLGSLLTFYVFYAVFYGFAIYKLFDGFGLLGSGSHKENVEKSEI